MAERNSKIAFVVLGGVGYMGMNGIRTLHRLNRVLGKRVFDPERLLVVDLDLTRPDARRRPEWQEMAALLGSRPHSIAEFHHALPFLWGLRMADPRCWVVIYDATPSIFHNGHLVQIAADRDPRTVYLGEKPIFTALSDLQAARHFPPQCNFYCDLIETESPVFRGVAQYLEEERLRVERLWMWRGGSGALRKALRADREVVFGGALEDKALHDFSITLGWLGGATAVRGVPDIRVQNGHRFCLSDRAVLFREPSFLSMNNGQISSFQHIPALGRDFHRDRFPADVVTSVDCDWTLAGGTVPASYLFSWVGVTGSTWEREFRQRWRSVAPLELPIGEACESKRIEELGRSFECDVQEVRAAIVQCNGRRGRQTILCNFLGKEAFPGLRRFAKAFGEPGELLCNIYEDPRPRAGAAKLEDLADIFKRIVQELRGGATAGHIGREATLLTHEVMLRAHEELRRNVQRELEKTGDSRWWQEVYPRSAALFAQRIRPAKVKVAAVPEATLVAG
ncbi:MAG TPA: hypothetical protein VFK81_06190 [Terriglobales bacterium]|nr:hypothetical protein [Terriglobales bacterium]